MLDAAEKHNVEGAWEVQTTSSKKSHVAGAVVGDATACLPALDVLRQDESGLGAAFGLSA